ncbi:hypothetical protein Droror1_Dr00027460 [Drosera rotundifolia]
MPINSVLTTPRAQRLVFKKSTSTYLRCHPLIFSKSNHELIFIHIKFANRFYTTNAILIQVLEDLLPWRRFNSQLKLPKISSSGHASKPVRPSNFSVHRTVITSKQ